MLNRRHSQETIISAFHTAKKYGLKTLAFTMIGFPGEEIKSIQKTYHLLKKSRPDIVQTTIFYPLKRTKLYDMMVQEGLFDPNAEMPDDYYTTNNIELIKYQFLLSNYYLPSFFLNIFLFVRNRKYINRIFLYFINIIKDYRMGGLSLVFYKLTKSVIRKIRSLISFIKQLL